MAVEEDDRFKLSARFKKKKDKPIEKDERFRKVFEDDTVDVVSKDGPKVDPFGRPLDNIAIDEIGSSSEEELDDDVIIEEEKENIEYGDISDRLAVVGCDWDNISADDLFVLFETMYKSIKNNNYAKAIRRTAIYLSDFGHEKITEEQIKGPSIETIDGIDDDEDKKRELIRKYQKERSRYYYGVVECEDADKAKVLYDELDGVEISYALDGLDLRFIPPDVQFTREPKSESFSIPDNYEPPVPTQSALRHSNVECKWDMTNEKRFKTLTKRFTEKELASLDLSEYLASDSDNENSNNAKEYMKLVKGYRDQIDDEGWVEQDSDDEGETETDGEGSDYTSEEEDNKFILKKNSNPQTISAKVGNFKISFGSNLEFDNYNHSTTESPTTVHGASPPKVQSNSPSTRRSTVSPAVSSSNYFPVNGKATPRDRGKGEGLDVMTSSTGPRVEPAADLREAKGQLNKEGRLQDNDRTSGGKPSIKDKSKTKEVFTKGQSNKRGLQTDDERHFDMRSKKVQQIGFESNFDDKRIERIFKDPKFAIDTTDPNYKKTEFNKKLLEQKSRRR